VKTQSSLTSRRLHRRIGLIALFVALVTAISAPVGYAIVRYMSEASALSFKARLSADRIAGYIYGHPGLWQYQLERLTVLIAFGNAGQVYQRVIDSVGVEVAAGGTSVAAPSVTRSAAIIVSESSVGSVQVTAGLWPLITGTAIVGSFSFTLSFLAYYAFRTFPLRMLDRTLGELQTQNTELQQAQVARLESEVRLERAQEIAGIGSWELDLRTGHYNWSKELYRIRGLPAGTFEPNLDNIAQFVDQDDYKLARLWLTDLQAGADRGPIETRIIRPNGDVRLLRVEGRAVPDPDGIIGRLAGTMQDITEGRLIEQQLV
jgi:PAS domain S-box-containing protein